MSTPRAWIVTLLIFAVPLPAPADVSAKTQAFPGIMTYSETRTEPPTRMFVAVIDLKNPKVHLRVVAGGADPDGSGKWETTLMTPTEIAAREHFDLVVNGDFFAADRGEGRGG